MVFAGGLLLLLNMSSMYTQASRVSPIMKTVSNGTQVLVALKQYSASYSSSYPDATSTEFKSANEVLRLLFQEGILTDERIFGSPESAFQPDNEIGSPPNFEKALMPGECHWMLLKGQWETVPGETPILIENAPNSTWPPKWDTERPRSSLWADETPPKRGRSWPGSTVVVVRNNGSAALEKLRPDGTLDWHSANNLGSDGESWIDKLTPEEVANLSYWDVEEK